MADFNLSINTILKHEGGFVDHPKDPGGATNFGISTRFLKSLPENELLSKKSAKDMTIEDAKFLYKKYFWDVNKYFLISNQRIATKIFDMCVNMGSSRANKIFQRAIMATTLCNLIVDGVVGMKTIKSVNRCDIPDQLLEIMRKLSADYYMSLNKQEFIKGWLERARS